MNRAAALRRDDAARGAAERPRAAAQLHAPLSHPAPPGKPPTRPRLYLASMRRDNGAVATFDTFGRMLKLTYPDGEVLTNQYDSGGNLKSAEGVKGISTTAEGTYRYPYLHALHYDKFEQRVLMHQGNGVKTVYTYDAKTRRLAALTATRQGSHIFQDLAYDYDQVGNILSLKNTADLPSANTYGGPSYQRYQYDDLYRLTQAQGVFPYDKIGSEPTASACATGPGVHCRAYTLDMAYDTIHNITKKNQADTRHTPGASAIIQKKTTYNWDYAYNPSGGTSVRPHAPIHIGERTFTYDANGNQTGWTHDQNGTRRTILWDEDNRIQTVSDNGHEKTYKYDDQGNRLIKRGPQGETVYVNQFYTQRPGATGTKHVYAGTSRIASKLLRQDVPNANPVGKTPYEKDLYFYHPDHLGSSSYVTDFNAKLYEHLEYFPFGEGWIEENSNVQRTPYLFTAKELDEETGLYYFGARYYDPRTSMWQSADPILGKYLPSSNNKKNSQLPGVGGVFRTVNLNPFHYAGLNPLIVVDPNGNEDVVLVPDSNPQLARFESKALAYEDKTMKPTNVGLLNLWGAVKGLFGGKLNEKDVKFFLGEPKQFGKTKGEFAKYSTLPDDPSTQGTMAAGNIYDYKRGQTDKGLPGLKLSSSLGEGNVPQDPNFNGGVNPAHPDRNPNIVEGAFVHGARIGSPNTPNYQAGSEGCATCYGFGSGLLRALDNSPTGQEGRVLILR